ncbi:MAG TPA: site-specific integrase [Candidatus Angelobacter sp.]|nr:site-specific integrase [Candidatus Angelobacter sp.]
MRVNTQVKHLENKAARAKLGVQRRPYWIRLNQSTWLGYKQGKAGGVWIARSGFSRSAGRLQTIVLGSADDMFEDDGLSHLSYEQAIALARKWSQEAHAQKKKRHRAPYTVADAMRDYMQYFIRTGFRSTKGTQRTMEFHILPVMGHIPVADLTRDHVRRWIESILEHRGRVRHYRGGPTLFEHAPVTDEEMRRRRQTANRLLQILKAALNFALQEGHVDCSGTAWREVRPFIAVRAGRTRFLSDEEQRMFVAACEGDFRNLVLGALYTGARYGELTRLRVDNFTGTAVHIPAAIAKNKKERIVYLEPAGATFFARLIGDRLANEFLFTKGGHQWDKNEQWYGTRLATEKAELANFTFCILRHTAAANWIRAGVSLKYVAEQLGHSIIICERHYAHVAPDHRQTIFNGLPIASFSPMETFIDVIDLERRQTSEAS